MVRENTYLLEEFLFKYFIKSVYCITVKQNYILQYLLPKRKIV